MAAKPQHAPQDWPVFCARCAIELHPGKSNFFLVKIDAVADPTPPSISDEDLSQDVQGQIKKLIAQMEKVSAAEAMDQVHRHLTLFLCGSCYQEWIEHPTGC